MYLFLYTQQLHSENCREEEDGSAKSYLQLFIGCVTPDNFPDILALFENGNSPLLHAKVWMGGSESVGRECVTYCYVDCCMAIVLINNGVFI